MQPRLALGVKVALTVLAHSKATTASSNIMYNTPPSSEPRTSEKKTAVRKFLADQTQSALNSGKDVLTSATEAWDFLVGYAHDNVAVAPPMSYEQARLFLQSYNAGPYACLKYKGNVPFRETRNYVPKVMKYYQMDLSGTPYDSYIIESATKYGLDPQMIRAVMKTESDFRRNTISSAGARGLMQVMPVVWSEIRKRYKLNWNYSSSVFDPEKNIEVACAYLAWLRYDFLPRHFAEFDLNTPVPAFLVRDKAKPRDERIETAMVPKSPKPKTDEQKPAVAATTIGPATSSRTHAARSSRSTAGKKVSRSTPSVVSTGTFGG